MSLLWHDVFGRKEFSMILLPFVMIPAQKQLVSSVGGMGISAEMSFAPE